MACFHPRVPFDNFPLTCLVSRLEKFLVEQTGRTLVVVSHDQSFLSAVVEETIILRNTSLRYFEGTPTAFEVNERKESKRMLGAKEALDKTRDHVSWHGTLAP